MRNASYAVIFLTVAADLIGFGIILPLMPFYARNFGASEVMVAVLFSVYSAGQFVFAPLWGRLSDHIGRRPVLLFSIAGNVAALTVFAFAQSFAGLIAARAISGICTANIAVANAYVADITPLEQRAKRMGMIGAAFGVGFVIGPFIGGELSRFGAAVPPLVAAGLSAINFVSALFRLPESLPKEKRDQNPPPKLRNRLQVLKVVPGLATPVALLFLQICAFSMLEMAFTLFLADRIGFGELQVGHTFAFIGVVLAIVQGLFVGPLARRFGEEALVKVGLVQIAVGMLALTELPPGPAQLAHIAFLGLVVTAISSGQGVTNPSLLSLVSRRTPAAMQGAALGLAQSCGALARILGPLAAGLLYKKLGANYPFLVGGVSMLGAFGLASALLGRAPSEPRALGGGTRPEVSRDEVVE
jgi:MFS transporter, DHA1 family, tetracycline resistance protein